MPVNNSEESKKSKEAAEEAKMAGNKAYSEKKIFEAILLYNESLSHAEVEHIGLAYANRSAIYCEVKLLNRTLKNIDLAKASGYPEDNYFVLDRRSQRCKEMIQVKASIIEDDNPWSYIKVPQPNPKIPFIARYAI